MALIDNFSEKELREIVENSTSFKEVIDKIGYTTHSGNNNKTVKSRLDKYKIDYSHFSTMNNTQRTEDNVFIENSTASQAVVRRWYLKGEYSEYKCSICGMEAVWQEKPLTLILDHINGNNKDDRLENLRWVCPNCNQQLDTTNGKNLKNRKHITKNGIMESKETKYFCSKCGKEITKQAETGMCFECYSIQNRKSKRPSREELKEIIRKFPFTQIGKKYGVSDNAIRKWCVTENLPKTKIEINSYSDEEWELL